nr:hypothetical protein [Actinomadura fibrosa]
MTNKTDGLREEILKPPSLSRRSPIDTGTQVNRYRLDPAVVVEHQLSALGTYAYIEFDDRLVPVLDRPPEFIYEPIDIL